MQGYAGPTASLGAALNHQPEKVDDDDILDMMVMAMGATLMEFCYGGEDYDGIVTLRVMI